jgi:hypothetical protein
MRGGVIVPSKSAEADFDGNHSRLTKAEDESSEPSLTVGLHVA